VAVAGGAALAALEVAGGVEVAAAIADGAAGGVLVGTASILHRRVDRRRLPVAAAALAWLAGSLSPALALLHRGPLLQALAGERDAAPGRVALIPVVAAYALSAFGPASGTTIAWAITLAGAALLAAGRAAGRRPRRARLGALAGLPYLAIALVATVVPFPAALLLYDLALIATCVLVIRSSAPTSAASVTGIAIELGRPGRTVADRVARAIGDPSLTIRIEGGGPFATTASGDDRSAATSASTRVRTPIAVGGETIAILEHDEASLADPRLLEAVAGLVRLALANDALEAEIVAQVAALEAARARLLAGADRERRRLARQLADGPGGTLDAVAERLATTAPELAILARSIRSDLDHLAAGLAPTQLATSGLAGGLRALAADVTLPTRLEIVEVDCAEAVALAAYFTCAEALANVVKHADATVVSVSLHPDGDGFSVAVTDDGTGLADARGRGLTGLADRVDTVGGRLRVTARAGGGTTVAASFPHRSLSEPGSSASR
jgi:signal transduction histidine kinase